MIVKGIVKKYEDVNISIENALESIANELLGIKTDPTGVTGYCLRTLEDTQKEGIYKYRDTSHHGSPDYKYELLTDKPDDVALYKNIEAIKAYVKNII